MVKSVVPLAVVAVLALAACGVRAGNADPSGAPGEGGTLTFAVGSDAGRIVEIGPTHQLFTAPTHGYTRDLLAAIPTWSGGGRPDDRSAATRS